jgi:hypothetical protein
VLAQVVLIFTGALTVMGLLGNLAEAAAQRQAEAAAVPLDEVGLPAAAAEAAHEPLPEVMP